MRTFNMVMRTDSDRFRELERLLYSQKKFTMTRGLQPRAYMNCRVIGIERKSGGLARVKVEGDRVDDATLEARILDKYTDSKCQGTTIIDEACIPKGVITHAMTPRGGGKSELMRALLNKGDIHRELMKTASFMEMYGGNPEKWLGTVTGRFNSKGGNMKTAWQFESRSPSDIDFDDIGASLTRKNPVALVHGNTEGDPECYVVVHPSIIKKAKAVDFVPFPEGEELTKILIGGGRVYAVKLADFPAWVQCAKDIKRASWDEEYRRKATFTVSLPKV